MMAKNHSSSPYVAIWAVLVVCLAVSLFFAKMHHPGLALTLIFSVAAFKAALVAAYYMHLKMESALTWTIVLSGIAVVAIVFVGLIPDIVYQFGRMSP